MSFESAPPRNSATHALEFFKKELRRCRRPTGAARLQIIRMQEAVHYLAISEKFCGPPNGEFIDRVDTVSEDVDLPRLPFDAICLEYDYVMNPWQFGMEGVQYAGPEDQPDRCCALAFYPRAETPISKLAENLYGPMDDGEFIVWAIMGWNATSSRAAVWMPALDPVIVTKHRRGGWSHEMRFSDVEKRILVNVLASEESIGYRIEGKVAHGMPVPDHDAILKELIADYGREALAIVELCNVLECSNVSTAIVEPSKALNKKRRLGGRSPFFAYRVLKLTESDDKHGSGSGTDDHASPRFHYRRGHVRRLSSGRKTWVRPAMVGDSSIGIVSKEYYVAARARSHD